MRTVVGHNGRKGVELSRAKRKFLIYDVKMFVWFDSLRPINNVSVGTDLPGLNQY